MHRVRFEVKPLPPSESQSLLGYVNGQGVCDYRKEGSGEPRIGRGVASGIRSILNLKAGR